MKLTLALLVLTSNESIGFSFSPTRSRPTFGIHSKSFQLNLFTNSYLDSLSSSAKSAIDNLESKIPSTAKNAIENVDESFSSSATHLIGDVKNSLSSSAKHLIDDMDIPPIPSSAKNIVGNMESSIPSSAKHAMENYSSHDMQKLLDSITTTTKSITTSRFSLDPALIDAKVLAASKFLEDMLPPAMQELKTKKYDFSNYFDEDGKSKIQVGSGSYFDADGNVVQSRFANVDEESATTNDISKSVQTEDFTYEETQLGGNGQNMKDIENNEMQIDSTDGEFIQQALDDPVLEGSYSKKVVDSDVDISTQTPVTNEDNLNIQIEEINPSVSEFEPETINKLDQQGKEMIQRLGESIRNMISGNAEQTTNEPEIPNKGIQMEETTTENIDTTSPKTQIEPAEVDQFDTVSVEDNIQTPSLEDVDTMPDVDATSAETQIEPAEVDQFDIMSVEDDIQTPSLEDVETMPDVDAISAETQIESTEVDQFDTVSVEETSPEANIQSMEDVDTMPDVDAISTETQPDVDAISIETQIEFVEVDQADTVSVEETSPEANIQSMEDVDTIPDAETQIESAEIDQADTVSVEDNVQARSLENGSNTADDFVAEGVDKRANTYVESSTSTVDGQSDILDTETISQGLHTDDFLESQEVPAVEFDSTSENNMVQATEDKIGSKLFDSNFDQNSAVDEFDPSGIDDSIAELDRRLAELQAEQDELERMAKQLVSQMKENINLEANSIEMFASDTTVVESADATNIVNAIYNQDSTLTVSHSSTTSALDPDLEYMKQNLQNMFQEFEGGNSIIDPNVAPAFELAIDATALVTSEAIVTESSGSMNENPSPRNDDNVLNDLGDGMFSSESSSVDEVMSSSAPDTANEVEASIDTMQPKISTGQTSTSQKSSTSASSQNESFGVENNAMENIDADMHKEGNSGIENLNVSENVETTSSDTVVSSSSPDTSIELESSRTMSIQDSVIAPSEEIRASTDSQVIENNPNANIVADMKANLETDTENTDNIIKVGKQVSKKIGDLKMPDADAGEKIGNSLGKMNSKANKMEYDFSIDAGVDQIPNAPSLRRIKLSEVTENSNKALTSMKDKFESVQGKVFQPFEEVQEKFNTFKTRNNAAFNLEQKVDILKNNKITEEADKSFVGPIKEKIQNSLQSTHEQDLAKQLEGVLSNNLKQVEGTLSGNLKQVEGTLSSNLKQVEGTLSSNVNQLEGALSNNLKQVEKNIKQVEGAISDDVSVINSKSSEILGKVADSEFVQQTTKVTKELADSEVVKAGAKVAKDVGTTSAKAVSTAVESEAVKGVTASLRSTADSITIRDIGNAFIATIKFIGVLVLKILDSILETCNQESVAELFEDTRSAISDTATSIGKTLNEFTINGFDGESFADIFRDIAGIIVQFTTAIGAIVTNILDIILEQSGAKENASELIHHIQDSFASLFQNIGDTSILEVIENIIGLVVAVANVIVNLLSTGKDTMDTIVTINGDVGSSTDNLATLIESVGTEIVSSMDSINIPI